MNKSLDAVKARAEAVFRNLGGEPRSAAMADYLSRQQAELHKTLRLRALRLARTNG
jgi:hypothetical protein